VDKVQQVAGAGAGGTWHLAVGACGSSSLAAPICQLMAGKPAVSAPEMMAKKTNLRLTFGPKRE